MGALTINRKRANDFANLSYLSTPNISFNPNSENQVSKKPRVSYENSIAQKPPSPVFTQSIGSRIRRYPEPTQHFRREVHAPCRKHKFFGSASSGGETRSDDMGNFLSNRYVEARNSAYEAFQHWREDKSAIDVEAECSKREVPSSDYSVEELEILDDAREGEGRSVVTEQKSLETNGVAYLQEKYAKFPDYVASSPGATDLANQIPKVDDTEKMLESLSVNSLVKELGVLPHQKLYESAERRNSRLGYIAFQIGLETKKLSFLSKAVKKPEEDALREPFASLTEEDEGEISRALSNSNRRKILVTHENSNIQITGEVMQCLRPGAWLNDEVINLYLELLKEREKREPKKFLKCHFFNTFFYKKLISGRGGYDYKAVKRWTTQRKIGYGLIECDKIFVPIHKEIHWCLAIINRKEEKFQYLDSLKGRDTHALKVLARYFMEEVKDKSAKDIDVSSWKVEYVDDLPEQENGWDCGMFMLKYTDFYSRGLGLRFNQEHMPYFRDRTIKEILRLKAE